MRILADVFRAASSRKSRHLRLETSILNVDVPPTYEATQWKYRGTNRAMIDYSVNDERIEINLLRGAGRDNRAR